MNNNERKTLYIVIMVLVTLAFWYNIHDQMLIGALIVWGGNVVNYYFGSSKTGVETATKNADAVTYAARASSEVQPVVVTNDETAPVPVEATK